MFNGASNTRECIHEANRSRKNVNLKSTKFLYQILTNIAVLIVSAGIVLDFHRNTLDQGEIKTVT